MSNQTKVGLVVIAALITLGLVVTWKSTFLLRFAGYEMMGSFENIEGLTTGSEIRYRGFKVGKVMRIDPAPEDIKIYCIVNRGIKFPADSSLRVAFDGLVGLKYLEIKPGKSENIYKTGGLLYGQKTSGIVDFVDMGTQSLADTKQILFAIKNIVERPDIQSAFINAVLNIEKATREIDRLTQQLQAVVGSVNSIISDENFQDNIKGTISATNKTLSSANSFFEGVSGMQIKPSADVLIGGLANQIKGNLDVKSGVNNYVQLSMGEGPTRNLALLDLQIASIVAHNLGLRIGMINTHLGGGLDYYMDKNFTLRGDMYDFNNPKPSNPKVRLTGEYKFVDYMKLLLQADDILNGGSANYSIGIRVKGAGD